MPSPTAAFGPEEPILRELPANMAHYGHISPGDGPIAMRPYHAIIEGTDKYVDDPCVLQYKRDEGYLFTDASKLASLLEPILI